jgi:hypothetical protein
MSGLSVGSGLTSTPGLSVGSGYSRGGGLYFGGFGPSLNLNFLSGTLDPRITFSRPSNATLYDSTGKLTYAPNNLVTYSNDFTTGGWAGGGGASVSGSSATFTTAANSSVYRTINVSVGVKYIWSITFSSSTAAGTIRLYDQNFGMFNQAVSIGTGVTNVYVAFTATQVNPQFAIFNGTAIGGDGVARTVTISNMSLSAITYETTPRTQDNIITTSAAYYGPRFDYNPSTLAAQGLLIEEARTNLALYSEQFDNAAWTKNACSVSANSILSPDGTVNADTITENSANDLHVAYQTVTLAATTAYTVSFLIKAGVTNYAMVRVGGGAFSTAPAIKATLTGSGSTSTIEGPVTSSSITALPNGWYRVLMTFTTAASSGYTPQVGPHDNGSSVTYLGNGTRSVYVYGAQLEAGSFATSYIPTAASSVARSADTASMTGTNFSSWFNVVEGTFVANYDHYVSTASGRVFEAHNGGNTNILISVASTGVEQASNAVSASAQSIFTKTAFANNTFGKTAFAYQQDNFCASFNGSAETTDTSGSVGTGFVTIDIGQSTITANRVLNGHIKSLTYYNKRLSNAQLQTLTT